MLGVLPNLFKIPVNGYWKLMVNEELDRVELYDIENDWAEANDVAKENSDVVKKLTKKVLAWKKSLPTKPPGNCFSKLRTEIHQ